MYRRRRNNQQPIYRVYTTSAYRSPLNMSVDRYLGGLPHTDYFAPEEAHRVATYISKQMQAARSKNKFVFVVEIMGNSISFLDFDAGKRLSYQDFQKEYSKSFSSSTQLYKRNPDIYLNYGINDIKRFEKEIEAYIGLSQNDTLVDQFYETKEDRNLSPQNKLDTYQIIGQALVTELGLNVGEADALREKIKNLEEQLRKCNTDLSNRVGLSKKEHEDLVAEKNRITIELTQCKNDASAHSRQLSTRDNEIERLKTSLEELKKKCPIRGDWWDIGEITIDEDRQGWDESLYDATAEQIYDKAREYCCTDEEALKVLKDTREPAFIPFLCIKYSDKFVFTLDGTTPLTLDEFKDAILEKVLEVEIAIGELEEKEKERLRLQAIADEEDKKRKEELNRQFVIADYRDFIDNVDIKLGEDLSDKEDRCRTSFDIEVQKYIEMVAAIVVKGTTRFDDVVDKLATEKKSKNKFIRPDEIKRKWKQLANWSRTYLYKDDYNLNKYPATPWLEESEIVNSQNNRKVFNTTPHTMWYGVFQPNKGRPEARIFMPMSGFALRAAKITSAYYNVRYPEHYLMAIFYKLDDPRNYWRSTDYFNELCTIESWGLLNQYHLDQYLPTVRSQDGRMQPIQLFVSQPVADIIPYSMHQHYVVADKANSTNGLKNIALRCFKNGCSYPIMPMQPPTR